MSMLNKAPTTFKFAALAAVLLAGPITVFAFICGGAVGGAVALLILFFLFIVLYMIAVRLYT
jgi:hypothetical protein